eukprot:7374938-Pyramimonas_sp.AAC.1
MRIYPQMRTTRPPPRHPYHRGGGTPLLAEGQLADPDRPLARQLEQSQLAAQVVGVCLSSS